MSETKSVQRRRPPGATLSPAEQLSRHLRPGEKLRWSARPDPRIYIASKLRPGYYGLLIVGLWLLWFVIALLQEGPAAVFTPQVMGYSLPLILPGLWLLSIPLRHARNSRSIAYGISDRRLIIAAQKPSESLLSFAPRDIRFIQRFDYENGLGSLFFSKATEPANWSWRRRSGWARIGFVGVAEPAEVEAMILALSQLRSRDEVQ